MCRAHQMGYFGPHDTDPKPAERVVPPGALGALTGLQRAAREGGSVRRGGPAPRADRTAQPTREPASLVATPCLDIEVGSVLCD